MCHRYQTYFAKHVLPSIPPHPPRYIVIENSDISFFWGFFETYRRYQTCFALHSPASSMVSLSKIPTHKMFVNYRNIP